MNGPTCNYKVPAADITRPLIIYTGRKKHCELAALTHGDTGRLVKKMLGYSIWEAYWVLSSVRNCGERKGSFP